MSKQPFWKRLFCVCTGEESNEQRPKSRSVQTPNQGHYQQQKQMQNPLEESNIMSQLKFMNQQIESPYHLITDNTQQCCFLVHKTQMQFPISKNLVVNSKNPNHIFDHQDEKKLLFDTKQNKIAPLHLSRYIAGRLKPAQRVLEINSQFNQHSIQFLNQGMSVIAVTQNIQHQQMGWQNLEQLKMNSLEISVIGANFANLRMDWNRVPIDAIFVNLTNYRKDKNEQTYQGLVNAVRITSDIVILLAGQRVSFLYELFARLTVEYPKLLISVSIEEQEIVFNNRVEFTLIFMGQYSKLNKNHLIEALYDRLIYSSKSYKEFELYSILTPIITDLIDNIGCIKVMKYFLESLYDVKQNQDLTNNFFRSLEQNKLINREKFIEYLAKYPIVSTPQLSPQRKPRKNTIQQQQSVSFNYDLQGYKTQNTDFLLDGGTFTPNNNNTSQAEVLK
ncbi:unnamed protein product [Paramecium primaurelia]|uniref:Uncharacterized protein n=1 Tax=Paramecium primaurelia TaxID=5886 RepID=A0A8S1M3E6_PARPR|nr:unnamed protein product [Paramecium primaurelia]